jgi:3-phenylpropionate/cinnamic acid dioxygenase small subunit
MPKITNGLLEEIRQFYYGEAELLDDRKFHEWLDLFTADTRYWFPAREAVQGQKEEFVTNGFGYMDDNKALLTTRVRRLDTGMAHVETPPSLTTHLITNVQAKSSDRSNEIVAKSNFLVFQIRHETYQSTFAGRRVDRLRKVRRHWKIARREVYLVQPVMPRAISIFF